jgi:hypothetical protein
MITDYNPYTWVIGFAIIGGTLAAVGLIMKFGNDFGLIGPTKKKYEVDGEDLSESKKE